MKLTSPNNSHRHQREKRLSQEPNQRDGPTPAKRCPLKWLLLALLVAGSFGVTYALVARSRDAGARPADGPPGMVWIPGGTFTMGTNDAIGRAEEKPASGASQPPAVDASFITSRPDTLFIDGSFRVYGYFDNEHWSRTRPNPV